MPYRSLGDAWQHASATFLEKKENGMDSPDWNRTFAILAISRKQLESLGIPRHQVARLSDEDMARIAASVAKTYPDFENRVRINVRTYLVK